MNIETIAQGNGHIVRISGQCCLEEVQKLDDAFMELINGGAKWLVVNIGSVSFLDSSGLGKIIKAYKEISKANQGRVAVAGAEDKIKKIFEITATDRFIKLFDSEADAAKAMGGGA
jgi:anti-sigma B factor antagonist